MKTRGYDGISSKVLKSCVDYISIPLSYHCNHSMAVGMFPERLKYSKVKPLYKKGEKSCISNHRPISLLTTFSKIF
jgi:Notch-like protein